MGRIQSLIMTKSIYESRTPEERRRAIVGDFLVKYPHPFFAWAERRRDPFWRTVLDRHLTPEGKAILIAGRFGGQTVKVPKMRELWDTWFRAAWATMVPEREGRSWDDLSAEALSDAFGLTRGRRELLVKAERKWRRQQASRPTKDLIIGKSTIRYTPSSSQVFSSVLSNLMELPAIEELVKALLQVPDKKS